MRPSDLRIESFAQYPPQARELAVENLETFKRMPLILLALVFRQVTRYDSSFPAERNQLLLQLHCLSQMDAPSFEALMSSFFTIPFAAELTKIDWVNHPQQFSEQLTTNLWLQHQIDSYHSAAQKYQQYMQHALPQPLPVAPRWTIVVIGSGVQQTEYSLFRRLKAHGTLFTKLDPQGGFDVLMAEVKSRTERHPLTYGHWYIDGGQPHPAASEIQDLATMSYSRLVPAVRQELALLNQFAGGKNVDGTIGVEAITSYIAGLRPEDMGLQGNTFDAPLRHFEVDLLTQGAGCQIFSTTFVQWAARECLHRAQPLTLFARFSTRQFNAPMEQLLTRDPLRQSQDGEGSLIDADMGAYYTWINQSRLTGGDQSRFLAWFEDHGLACAIAPGMARGTVSTASASMRQVLEWMG